jgi:hypothetical protein
MSDITELFSTVAPVVGAEPSGETVEADLSRGRLALARDHRRRTIRRSMATTTTVAAAAVVVLVATQLHGSGSAKPQVVSIGPGAVLNSSPHHSGSATPRRLTKVHHVKTTPIKLVAYSGKQLSGFTVDKVPVGWFLSSSTQYALLIDPNGDKDNDPDAFVGKLAVLTQSRDVHGLPNGTPVTVNGQPGVVTDQGKYGLSLTYNDPAGFGVVIQAPPTLNWSDGELVSFADGVHVTGNAIPSRG